MTMKVVMVGNCSIITDNDNPKKPPIYQSQWDLVSGSSNRNSNNYNLEDWAEAMCKHDGKGIHMSDGKVYPTWSWNDLTSQEQTRAVERVAYAKRIKF